MFRKIFYFQTLFAALYIVGAILAYPIMTDKVMPSQYHGGKCAEVAPKYMWTCTNYNWILHFNDTVFLPGFISILLWPFTFAVFVYAVRTGPQQIEKKE